jgi:hypothetical protein
MQSGGPVGAAALHLKDNKAYFRPFKTNNGTSA